MDTVVAPEVPHVVWLDRDVLFGRDVLGGKAWSIVDMQRMEMPVPPAFALPVPECARFHRLGHLDDDVWTAVTAGVAELGRATGRSFGGETAPLLVSVRSGAPVSMPGMMDTVLNLGITDRIEAALARESGDAVFARNTNARFCHQFGRIVLGAEVDPPGPDADAAQVRRQIVEDCGESIPDDPFEQLSLAIRAVFRSWLSRRAVAYRKHYGIADAGGTAVTVQAMVFGNLGADSGTGVFFTRNPLSGSREPYGEWLPGGQGEDVVSGTHSVKSLADLAERMPAIHDELLAHGRVIEARQGDVQDIEFTIERGRLFLLQTRAAKRSPLAAVTLAVQLAGDGLIDSGEALRRVTATQVGQLLQPRLAPEVTGSARVLGRGEPACPGVGAGRAIYRTDEADRAAAGGEDFVLVRPTTSPDDVPAMIAAQAVVTELGGATSHAAVVCRALGRPCVVGVGEDAARPWLDTDLTVDGQQGVVYDGILAVHEVRVEDHPDLAQLLDWAREHCPVGVGEGDTGDVFDLDAAMSADAGRLSPAERPADAGVLAEALRGKAAVRGSMLDTAEGAAALVSAGVRQVVPLPRQNPLIVTLRILEAARAAPGG